MKKFFGFITIYTFSFSLYTLNAQQVDDYIDIFYGGAPAPGLHQTDKERWGFKQLAENNLITIFYSRGPTGFGTEPEDTEWLADQDINILYQLWYGHEHNFNILDIYYNYKSCQDTVKTSIDYHFNWLDPDKVWAVRLGDEEPAGGGYRWRLIEDSLPEEIAKYDSIYYQDTGDHLKPLMHMSHSEYERFFLWANDKNTWVLNWMYDYVKMKWPHLYVFQNVFFRPMDWAYAEPYFLKADGFMYDHYTTEMDGFWDVYNTTRYFKTIFPDKPFHMLLWGISHIPGIEPADRLIFKKMAWASYLGGAEGIGWFTLDSVGLNYWQTEQEWAIEDFEYLNALNKDLMEMTCFVSQPKILVIGLGPSGAYRIGLFKEYNTISEDFLAMHDFDLTEYDIIFVFGEIHYNEVVSKLNTYVQAGGNLALNTTLLPENPQSVYGRRDTKFLFEENGFRNEYDLSGKVTIEVDTPNLLNLEFDYIDSSFQTNTFQVKQNAEYFYPIGNYYTNGLEFTEGYPCFLYRENSNHGWICYNGYVRYEHSHEQAMLLWNKIFRAFALNLLNNSDCITTEDQKGTLISPGKINEDKLLVGMVNNIYNKTFSYTINLERFELTDGTYYVYSGKEMQFHGEYTSDEGKLSFPIDLLANDVKLFYITDQPLKIDPEKDFSKNLLVFKNYPNPFANSITFEFNLAEKEFVTLKIYNVLGEEVYTLLNKVLLPGVYKQEWDASILPNGTYFCRIEAGKFYKVNKIVVLR